MYIGILKRAICCAKESKMYPFKMGCVCFRGKKILSCGFNQKRFSKNLPNKDQQFFPSLHAEQHAIMKIKNKELLRGSSILIIRVTNSGKLSMARPCQHCLDTIRFFRFKEMYFSNENGEIILERLFYE